MVGESWSQTRSWGQNGYGKNWRIIAIVGSSRKMDGRRNEKNGRSEILVGISALNIMYLLAPATEINGISLGLEKDRELGICSVKTRFIDDTTSGQPQIRFGRAH